MRTARDLPPLQVSVTRPVTSLGARGLLNVGFGMSPGHPEYAAMREEFLRLYESNICRESRLFPGMSEDRKSTRLNSSHSQISYAVFCLKKKKVINSTIN